MKSMQLKAMGPLATAILLLAATTASASSVKYEYATVVETTPLLKTVRVSTPVRECWDQEVAYREPASGNHLAPVMGGILGGAFGNAVGHSTRNKQVGTVVGAVLGATIGHAAALESRRGGTTTYRTEERCEVHYDSHEEERIEGYQVRYRYAGETYTTRMDQDPGDTIKLRVSVSPVN